MLRSEVQRRAAATRTEVVRLHLDGLTYKEVAERLGLTFNQVRAHIQYDRRLNDRAPQDGVRVP